MTAFQISITVICTLLAFLLAAFIFGLAKYRSQSKHVYGPKKDILATPSDIGLQYEEVFLKTADGLKINGWYIDNADARYTILIFHGKGGNISTRLELISLLFDLALSVFIIDYRGYGKSEGVPSERGTYIDSESAWDYLTEKLGKKHDEIIVLGRSLGGPIAARLASIKKPSGLILDSTFTSMKDIASELYPYLPVRKFMKYEYNTLGFLKDLYIPVLVIHSQEDSYIKISHAEIISVYLGNKGKLVRIKGAHGDSYYTSKEKYMAEIRAFTDKL